MSSCHLFPWMSFFWMYHMTVESHISICMVSLLDMGIHIYIVYACWIFFLWPCWCLVNIVLCAKWWFIVPRAQPYHDVHPDLKVPYYICCRALRCSVTICPLSLLWNVLYLRREEMMIWCETCRANLVSLLVLRLVLGWYSSELCSWGKISMFLKKAPLHI